MQARWHDWLAYLPVFALHRFIHALPRPLWSRFARGVGTLSYWLLFPRRRQALQNLNRVYGSTKSQKEKRAIAKGSFQNFVNSLFELFWAKNVNPQNYTEFIECDEQSWREMCHARKKGPVIVLLGHIGNWELLSIGAGYQKLPVHYVARSLNNPLLDRLIDGLRGSSGLRVVYKKGATNQLREILKRGEMIAVLMDQKRDLNREGILVPFLGQPAPTTGIVAKLALETGASIMHCYPMPLGGGRWRAVYQPPIPFTATGNREKDIEVLTRKCNEALSETIQKHPHIWLWGHNRWDTG